MTVPPAKVRDWMESLVDYMIQKPNATYEEMGRYFNCTPIWIGVVIRSDAFQELLKTRREVHMAMVSSTVIEKVEALANQALDKMSDKMAEKDVPLGQVKDIGDMALKALGFGVPRGTLTGAGAVNNQVNVIIDREALAEARAKMAALRSPAQNERLLDGQVINPDSAGEV